MKSFSAFSFTLMLGLAGSSAALAQAAKHGYIDVLAHPITPAAMVAEAPVAAPAPAPAVATAVAAEHFKLSEDLKLALDAARLDADAKRGILEAQRARGGLDEQQFRLQMDQYQVAVQAYDQLSAQGGEVADEQQAEVLKSKLLDFNRSGGFKSMLADVGVRRGEDGSVLAERASLEDEVVRSVDQLRASLPEGQDTRPAQAYLDSLQRNTLNRIREQSSASDALPLADAVLTVQPVQQTQALMLSGPAPNWNIKVRLSSSPANALVMLFTESGYRRNFLTDSSRTVMRGLLEYMVVKPGYKTVQGKDLDLVTAVTGEFTCTLVRTDDPDPPLPCQIQ